MTNWSYPSLLRVHRGVADGGGSESGRHSVGDRAAGRDHVMRESVTVVASPSARAPNRGAASSRPSAGDAARTGPTARRPPRSGSAPRAPGPPRRPPEGGSYAPTPSPGTTSRNRAVRPRCPVSGAAARAPCRGAPSRADSGTPARYRRQACVPRAEVAPVWIGAAPAGARPAQDARPAGVTAATLPTAGVRCSASSSNSSTRVR